ncbi:ATP-binding protein [Nocardiopsis lucentensis]|uniref:ATP-binding protein n=1 Tax=Nocardiopsis lucentensis TaxID=53441 RepID=UPI00126932B1|nr:ATP-binding protein [Nocardiopsis lucentensis]
MHEADIPRPRRSQHEDRQVAGGLPVRVRGRRSGESTAYFDGTPDQVGRIRDWSQNATGLDPVEAAPVGLVVSEFVTNAVRHTASGGRYGRVKVSVEVLPGTVVLVSVTDDGPRPGRRTTVPRLPERTEDLYPGGRGLLLVAAVAEKWWWTGLYGGPLTVWALIDPHHDLVR